jgi:hypothetical protein
MALELPDSSLMLQPFLFRPTAKANNGRRKFLPEEDAHLRQLVENYGATNWNLISSFMNHRNPRQCRERYKNYLSPTFRNNPWTPAEEQLLEDQVRQHGPKWSLIARAFDGRSDVNVKNHWAAIASRNERIERYARAKGAAGEMRMDEFRIERFSDDEKMWGFEQAGGGDNEDFEFFGQ